MTSSANESIPFLQAESHPYQRPTEASRSPCPALNSLANHGYLPRSGKNITFSELVHAIALVYNVSYFLATILTIGGFVTCGSISFRKASSAESTNPILRILAMCIPSITLDLSSLSRRGATKIAHDAALVHPNGRPSTSPDPALLNALIQYASTERNNEGKQGFGLGLVDIAYQHSERAKSSPKLSSFHTAVSLGECALTWETLRGHQHLDEIDPEESVARRRNTHFEGLIPPERLEQFFGEERLPDGWWDADGVRPTETLGLIRARKTVSFIKTVIKNMS